MNLPSDASNDQVNCPVGYYRRNSGMLHQLPTEDESTPPSALSASDLSRLEGMSREELLALIQKVSKAGWGYGGLKGKDLLEMALKSKEEAYEALKLAALTLATNAGEWREFIALATFWAEREKGKPSQAVEVSGKVGIIQLVLEAQKLGEVKTIENQ